MQPSLSRIVTNITRPIPKPAYKPGKSIGSWRGLKLGDLIQHSAMDPAGWTVKHCSRQGVLLGNADGLTMRVTDPNWKANGWRKIVKPRSGRPKKGTPK
jgi:hypothetical protein